MAGNLWQASTLGALMLGRYEATTTVGAALEHGDVGLGTFEGVGGELIVLNGIAYNATVEGKVDLLRSSTPVSFCTVAPFDHYAPVFLSGGLTDLDALKAALDSRREVSHAANSLHAVMATGTFSHVRIRSIAKQHKPYPPLDEATLSQRVFDLDNVNGTIVGVRFPSYLAQVNMPGWHLHLITEDRRRGGHLLGLEGGSLACQITRFDDFELSLPHDKSFARLDLSRDLSERTRSVEG